MVVMQALQGAQMQISQAGNIRERAWLSLRLLRTFLTELAGIVTTLPYGLRAYACYRRALRNQFSSVVLQRNLRYGKRKRCVMDLYEPLSNHTASQGPGSKNCTPKRVVLFVHGGTWTSGDKWQCSCLALRLAQAGMKTFVMNYSLYPSAWVPQMVKETSDALSSVLDFCGDDSQVAIIGHSAGAQLCAMALLQRLPASRHMLPELQEEDWQDARMPAVFLGLAGCYDIAKHYQFEADRGVEYLSSMTRAMGGPGNFAAQSPSVVLTHCARQLNMHRDRASEFAGLAGESIPHRMGLIHATVAGNQSSSSLEDICNAADSPTQLREDLRRLPQCIVMHGISDATVPWLESTELHWRLQDCGVNSRLLLYKDANHADFITGWQPRGMSPSWIWQSLGAREADTLLVQDILKLLTI